LFLPVARIHAEGGLHGEWLIAPALSVVAQIRALAEEDDTLDTLPDNLPLDAIMKAARWTGLEESASWNRKLAVCLRNSGYDNEAIIHFERALELDHDLVEARGGLATAYQKQVYITKVVDLELTNVEILRHSINTADERGEPTTALSKKLCISYEIIAHAYHHSDSPSMALKYYRKAAETTNIEDWAIVSYLRLLADSTDDDRWFETLRLFQTLQTNVNETGQNRLTEYIQSYMWPGDEKAGVFVMAATAAKKTGNLKWLFEAYSTAIDAASCKSHLSALILKLSLWRIYSDYAQNYSQAELLLDEVMAVASIPHAAPLRDLEECKKIAAKDYCCMCVRRALKAGKEDTENLQLWKVLDLYRAGVEPSELEEKIFRSEDTMLYLALLQRLTGSIEDVAKVLQPYLMGCYRLIQKGGARKEVGTWMIGVSLLALGSDGDGLAFIRQIHAEEGSKCDGCKKIVEGRQFLNICQFCFRNFCQACSHHLEPPQFTRFCLPGHRCLPVEPELASTVEDHIVFRNVQMSLDECLNVISTEWDLEHTTA
jgi:tetratricopeptide (TPR) repeat protein